MKLEFTPNIFEKKNISISNFKKIRPVGAAFLHADGQTDMKLVASFAHFRKRAQNRV